MKTTQKYLLIGGAAVAVLALATSNSWQGILKNFLYDWEGFRTHPYWDVSRWSWGYGTPAPGSQGTITRSEAMAELLEHAESDRSYLQPLLTVHLQPEQWAALLSFSYNLGPYDADNLVKNLNNRDWDALETQWKKYIYVDGQINQHQIERRNAEWELFSS